MQHEMQHEIRKTLENQGFLKADDGTRILFAIFLQTRINTGFLRKAA